MARNEASITARCQGGGPKLSGTAPRVGKGALLLTHSYNRVSNTTDSRKAYKLLGSVCRNAGCACDKAIDSIKCQGNPACRKVFPYNQHPANSGVYPTRWART